MTWCAAHVASNKEYDTKREMVSLNILTDDDIFIPRRQTYDVKDEEIDKKTETMLPGYILLNLSSAKAMAGLESMSNYIKILGPVTDEEMEDIRDHENIPIDLEANAGDKIIVTKGPFTGVKGSIISEDDTRRHKCLLVFHGNEITVVLDSNIIEKIT